MGEREIIYKPDPSVQTFEGTVPPPEGLSEEWGVILHHERAQGTVKQDLYMGPITGDISDLYGEPIHGDDIEKLKQEGLFRSISWKQACQEAYDRCDGKSTREWKMKGGRSLFFYTFRDQLKETIEKL